MVAFNFPRSGGLVARSLAGLGKEMRKSKQQLQVLANQTSPIAGATGAEISVSTNNMVQVQNQEIYNVKFVQHASDHQQPSTDFVTPVNAGIKQSLPKSGFALKTGGAKQTMIEFYNRQANHGIRAECMTTERTTAMRERGLEVLK